MGGLINESGTLVVKYDYNEFGKILSVIDTSGVSIGEINPFRYKGYYYDNDSQMYYCKSRYYVPAWGRWLNADNPSFLDFQGFSQTNLFSYCGNDPVLYFDIDGNLILEPLTTIFLLTGLLIIIIISLACYTSATPINIEFNMNINFDFDYHVPSFIRETTDIFDKDLEDTMNSLPVSASENNEVIKKVEIETTMQYSEHTRNKRKSNLGKHQKGNRRREMNRGRREKGDVRRPYKRNKKYNYYDFKFIHLKY